MERKHYVVSIGLNVGASEPEGQLGATLRAAEALLGAPLRVAMGESSWEGIPERFVQVTLRAAPGDLARRLQGLAAALHQDAVAVIGPKAVRWTVHYAVGVAEVGGPVSTFPVL